jgi:hypothetical protein
VRGSVDDATPGGWVADCVSEALSAGGVVGRDGSGGRAAPRGDEPAVEGAVAGGGAAVPDADAGGVPAPEAAAAAAVTAAGSIASVTASASASATSAHVSA